MSRATILVAHGSPSAPHGAASGASLPEPEYYDFPWGRRLLAVCEHEATIGGDGYGDRCCGTADVPVVSEAAEGCARRLCERCCDDTCCRQCHARSVEGDEETCRVCQAAEERCGSCDAPLTKGSRRCWCDAIEVDR